MSNPIVLTCPTDASSSGRSTPPWHADAVRGRPSHHSRKGHQSRPLHGVPDGRGGGPLSPVSPHSGDDPRPATKAGDDVEPAHEGGHAGTRRGVARPKSRSW